MSEGYGYIGFKLLSDEISMKSQVEFGIRMKISDYFWSENSLSLIRTSHNHVHTHRWVQN